MPWPGSYAWAAALAGHVHYGASVPSQESGHGHTRASRRLSWSAGLSFRAVWRCRCGCAAWGCTVEGAELEPWPLDGARTQELEPTPQPPRPISYTSAGTPANAQRKAGQPTSIA